MKRMISIIVLAAGLALFMGFYAACIAAQSSTDMMNDTLTAAPSMMQLAQWQGQQRQWSQNQQRQQQAQQPQWSQQQQGSRISTAPVSDTTARTATAISATAISRTNGSTAVAATCQRANPLIIKNKQGQQQGQQQPTATSTKGKPVKSSGSRPTKGQHNRISRHKGHSNKDTRANRNKCRDKLAKSSGSHP